MSNTNALIALAKQEKWHRGDLNWKLHKAQRAINESFNSTPTQLFVGNCSRQFGKSFWAVTKAVEQALKQPNSQIRYGAAFQSDLKDFIIPAFEKVMEDCPATIKGKYKTSGTVYVFPNGSRIKLVGLDKNPNGLRGNTLDLIILDECGFVSNLDYLYKSVIIPATTHRPDCKIVLISTPPATPAHSFMDYVIRAEAEGGYSCFTICDNPMVNATTIIRLMKETDCVIPSDDEAHEVIEQMLVDGVVSFPDSWFLSTTFRREYLCEFILDDDLALVKEWKEEYIQDIERDEYYGFYHKYTAMDLGRKDHTALVYGYYDFKRATLIIEDEMVMQGSKWTTETLAHDVLAKEKELWSKSDIEDPKPFRRISDNNNPHLIIDLSSIHDIHFKETNKESLEAMVNDVRIMVGKGQLLINPRCKMTIGCLKYGIWDEKRKMFARSKVYGHFDHFAALMYLIRNVAKHTNPIPADYSHDFTRSWMNRVDGRSNNVKTLENTLMPKNKKRRF